VAAPQTVRVRFAPSPTGSLHLGSALTAVANRTFADENRGVMMLRIDDTDEARRSEGSEEGILRDLEWLGVAWEEGPFRQSERGKLYERAAAQLVESGAATSEADGAVRLQAGHRPTLLRSDGTATYHLASVVDDVDLRITHVIRGKDHLSSLELHQTLAAALGAEPPEYVHHGLLLAPEGGKLSKRDEAGSLADLRAEGIPPAAVRGYLRELALPRTDVRLDLSRLRRLAVEAIAAMPDEELADAAEAPVEFVPALRGARTLAEARLTARSLSRQPDPTAVGPDAAPTLDRFVELRERGPDRLTQESAREVLRELKAIGGDLRALRLTLTGAASGPELSAVLVALDRDEVVQRARTALLAVAPPDRG
jgi:tRNA synthetases class I (E and Q), catalytic domain